MFDPSRPPPADLAVLHSFPHPACLHDAAFDLVEVNTAFEATFPGAGRGANLLSAILLDPMARTRLGNWETEARLMVSAFKRLAPALVGPERVEEIRTMCRRIPEWDRLWDGADEAAELALEQRTVRMLEPGAGREREHYVQSFQFQTPARPWWLLTVIPFD
ncbi:MmyB family transcriptional regulator [Nocardia inohanensis]|uniref:MmyB family transcriptional regulator n=1 Tax=Nocardia inohanensis TaxID=209246 RepID=UPI0008351858|nr:hypothetical protein [Nocardia inohanensis]